MEMQHQPIKVPVLTQIWRILGFLGLTVAFYVLSQLVQTPIILMVSEADNTSRFWYVLLSVVIYGLVLAFALVFAQLLSVINLREKLSWKKLLAFSTIGEVAIWMVSIIGALISLALHDELSSSNQMTLDALMTMIPSYLMFIMVCLGAPILEELTFRGFFPRLFTPKWQWIGYILGAILFGLVHAPNTVGSAVQYIGMGLVLSAVTYFSKRLEYSMILHFIHNGIAFIIMMLSIS